MVVTEATGDWPYLAGVERSTLRELLIHGTLARAEIAGRLRVSRPSLTRATRLLIENSMIAEDHVAARGGMGRPREMLVVRDDVHHFLGIKLTGDAVFAVVTNLRAQVVAEIEEPLKSTSVEDAVNQIVSIHKHFAEAFTDIQAAGICLAGEIATVDGRQIVLESYFLQWRSVPLAELLGARLGIPVTTDNDVRALTAAEHWFGAGSGSDSLALITIGAGIGFGFVAGGKVVTGHNGRAGNLGHLIVDSTGPACSSGHSGCASVYLPSERIVSAIGDDAVDYAHAVILARQGNVAARKAFDQAGRALGVIISTVANGLDPEKIVLTGDGLAVMEISSDSVYAAIASFRRPVDDPVPLDVEPFEFSEWARAGAVVAIRSLLQF